MRSKPWIRRLLAGLLSALLVIACSDLIGGRDGGAAAAAAKAPLAASPVRTLAIGEQPFYPALLAIAKHWSNAPLGEVVGESPQATVLNFYAVMARVAAEQKRATDQLQHQAGLMVTPKTRHSIAAAEELFGLAVEALDGSDFPESVREDMASEAAMQLKEVLDYVFSHSTVPLVLPDAAALKAINSQRSQASQSWTLPNTSITLVQQSDALDGSPGFVFSAGTVAQVGRMHAQVASRPAVAQPFATPNFYDATAARRATWCRPAGTYCCRLSCGRCWRSRSKARPCFRSGRPCSPPWPTARCCCGC